MANRIVDVDTPTAILFGMLFQSAHPETSFSIDDIDKVHVLAKDFHKQHASTNWEESDTNWIDAAAEFYNENKPWQWNAIPMVVDED